jgi:hypothetical protein
VIVQQSGHDEWIAISREPAIAGETLVLDIVMRDPDVGDLRHRQSVWVVDSRPIIIDGDMRHRIRLHAGNLAPALFEQQVRRG